MKAAITVFTAYQYSQAKLARTTREHAIAQAVQQARKDLAEAIPGVVVEWRKCDLHTGLHVGEQILNMIDSCDIFVADISEGNPNVLFELGIAYGQRRAKGKHVLWLAHDSVDLTQIPSDLRGLYVERYDEDSFQPLLTKRIYDMGISVIDQRSAAMLGPLGVQEFWGLGDKVAADIVCSEIPAEEQPYYANPTDRNYLRYAKFADLDTLIYLKYSIAKLYPNLNVRDFSPSEYFDTHTDALFVVGGPPWNAKFREFQSQLPFHFISRPLGEDDPLHVHGIDNVLFTPTWREGGVLSRDILVFARMVVGSGVPVFLIGGCLTAGVLGSAIVFLDREVAPRNCRFVLDAVGPSDFAVVAEASMAGGFLQAPDFEKEAPLVLVRRDHPAGDWRICVNNTERYVERRRGE